MALFPWGILALLQLLGVPCECLRLCFCLSLSLSRNYSPHPHLLFPPSWPLSFRVPTLAPKHGGLDDNSQRIVVCEFRINLAFGRQIFGKCRVHARPMRVHSSDMLIQMVAFGAQGQQRFDARLSIGRDVSELRRFWGGEGTSMSCDARKTAWNAESGKRRGGGGGESGSEQRSMEPS